MSMLMTSAATERDVLVVNGLDPIFVLILQNDGPRKRLGYVQIDTDVCIGSITPLLRGLRRFDIYTNGVADTRQNLLKPELLW